MKKALLSLLVSALIAPFSALLHTVALRLLWAWFLAPEYGPGPSTRAWFGISTIVGLAFIGVHYAIVAYAPAQDEHRGVRRAINRVITLQVATWFAVLLAFLSVNLFGWR